jgi:hypothetical protein
VKAITIAAAVQTTSASIATAVSGTPIRLGIHWDANDGVTAIVKFLINGVTVVTQKVASASLSNLYPFVTVRAASGGSAETITLDYFRCVVDR